MQAEMHKKKEAFNGKGRPALMDHRNMGRIQINPMTRPIDDKVDCPARNLSRPSSDEFKTMARRCSNEIMPRAAPKNTNERQEANHKRPIVDLFGFDMTGIKVTHTKKKHVVPIPILNPLNGYFSTMDRVS